MVLTDEQLQAIKTAVLAIDYGSVTIQIGTNNNYLDIDVHNRVRINREHNDEKLVKNT